MIRKWKRALWVLLALAFVLRLGFAMEREGLTAASDERHWDGVARGFWLTGLTHPDAGTYRPPLYPLIVAATYAVLGHQPAAVRIWQAGLGAATCFLLFTLGRRLGDVSTGLIAAGAGTVYPLLLFFAGLLMAETLLVFLTLASLTAWTRYQETPCASRALAFGALAGLAGLTKPVFLVWVPFALAGWVTRYRLHRILRIRDAAIAAAAVVLVIAPWTVRNRIITGHWVMVSSNLGMNLMVGNEPAADGLYADGKDYLGMFAEMGDPEVDPVVRDRMVAGIVASQMLRDPVRTVRLAIKKVLLFWSPMMPGASLPANLVLSLSSGALICLGLAGLYFARVNGVGGDITWAVTTLALSFTLVHAVFFVHIRFRLPVDAALMPFAAAFGSQILLRLKSRHGGDG